MLSGSLRRIVGLVATLLALTIAIAVPAGYLAQQYLTARDMLGFKARFTADRVARYVYIHQDMWQYHGVRIAPIIAMSEADAVRQQVTDLTGAPVVEQGPIPRQPVVTIRTPIQIDGQDVGHVTLTTTLHPIIVNALLVTALSWVVAAIGFFAVRSLPMRALDRVMAELAREQARFRLALDNMGEGLCMIDQTRRLVVVSRRMIDLFDLSDRGSLVGMHAAGLLGLLSTRLADGERLPARLFDPPVSPDRNTPHLLRLCDERMIAVTGRPTTNGLLVVTFNDVTDELRAREAEVERGKAQAESRLAQETSRAKSMFLATMSHEIRTPMNAVLGLATSLLDTNLTPEQHRAVATIHESGDSLLRILNDILDYSKLEAGKLVFEDVTFVPATLAEAARSILGPRARVKGIGFEVHTIGELPAALSGDAARLRQVILNLVSNAVKFTEKGQVTVETECLSLQAGQARIRWQVRDTGIGIPPDRLGALFSEFVQADGSINRRFGGSGLGLAICKRIIEQMGGAIQVESEPGIGSVFTFEVTLPVVEPVSLSARPENTPDPAAALRALIARQGHPPRVLVAEDNVTNQFVIRQMLKAFDIRLDMAANGAEAVEMAQSHTHDLIFMDMQMPEVDGLAATRMIRAQGGRLATVPIVALTGNAFDDDQRACLDAGMNAFIAKPINKSLLLATLVALCPWTEAATEVSVAD